MNAKIALAVMLIVASVWIVPAAAQTYPPPTGTGYGGWPTYDDNAADYPVYPLYPSPFVFYNGTAVTNTTQWSQRKTELHNILDYFYRGHAPPASSVSVSLASSTDTTIGSITKRALSLRYTGQYGTLPFFINLFIPHASSGPFANGVPSNGPYPIILSGEGSWCNLDVGNEPRLRWFANKVMRVWRKWLSRRDRQSVVRPIISGCGLTSQSDLETLVDRGYILAEFGRDDFSLDPNGDCTQPINCSNTGARTLYPYDDNGVTGYDWGAIQAWAWGFSRAIDYLMTLSYVDHNHIGVAGISRGADAALWAGANDSRVALTIQDQGGWLECRFNAKAWSNYPYSFYPPINNAGDFEGIFDRMPIANPGGNGTSGWFNIRIWPFANSADNLDVSAGGCNQLPFDDPSVDALIAPRAYLSSVDPSGYAMWNQTNDFVADKLIWGAFGATSKIGIFTTSFGHIMPNGAWAVFLDFADGVWFNHYVRSAMATAVTVTPGDGCCSPADYTAPYYPAANLPPSTNTWTVPNLSGATAPTVPKPRR